MTTKIRCSWCLSDPLYIKYHDKEWGKPIKRDQKLFEFLTLEGAQAGLSWITVLKKRENYLTAFDHFDPEKVARYNQKKIKKLMENPGLIRNRLKIESTVQNAKALLKIRDEFGSFSKYIWKYTEGKTLSGKWKHVKDIPANTPLSDQMSKDLKKSGFKFVGSTICYAFMQACGMVNDHTTSCFRYNELNRSK